MKKLFYDRNDDVHEAWKMTGACFGLFIMVIIMGILLAGTFSVLEYGECSRIQTYESGHDYRWSLFTGCMVQTEQGYWVDSDNPVLVELEGE